jgi:chaperonin GroES
MDADKLVGDSEKVTTDKAMAASIETSPELVNLASKLDEETAKNVAALVIEEFERDDRSRQEWLRMHAKWLKLYYQMDEPINPPWPGSSTEGIPMLTEACNQFQSRAYRAFFPSRFPVTAIPVGKFEGATLQRADRVGKFMSWQLTVKDRQYKRDKAALLLGVAIHGSVFTKTYYDPVLGKNCVRNVRAQDLVVNYGEGPRRIDEIERKTELVFKSVNETRTYAKLGYFTEPAEPYQSQGQDAPTQASQKAEGAAKQLTEEDGIAMILEQHRLLDLDGDGIAEPYIAHVCRQSEKLLRLTVRYEADQMGTPIAGKTPVEYYTHYQFLPNPEGFYGLGLGFLLEKPNSGVNKLLRQFIDSATLSTAGNMSGFISSSLAVGKGDVTLELGKFRKVEASNEDIQRGIKNFSFPGPTPALSEAIQLLMNESKRLSTVTDVVTGDVDKVMQPTTVTTLVDQSLQMFTSVQEFLLESWGDELGKLYKLNGRYMKEAEYAAVIGGGSFQQIVAGADDFLPDLRLLPIADPRMATTKQRQEKAMLLYQFGMANPLIMQNPQALYEMTRRVLDALEVEDIDAILPSPEMLAMQQMQQQAMQQEAMMQQDAAMQGQAAGLQEQGLVQGLAEGLGGEAPPTGQPGL